MWRDVVVGVHGARGGPEDEVILLNWVVRRWTLQVGREAEVLRAVGLMSPVDEHAEVLDPLAEAVVGGVGAIDGVRDFWAVEDTTIVRSDVELEEFKIACAVWARCCSDG